MEIFNKVVENNIWYAKVINSCLVIIVNYIVYNIVISFLNRSEEKARIKFFKSSKGRTYIKLIKSVIKYLFIIISILIILQVNGINITSIVAGVGVFGLIFGFTIQDWLKDIVRGSSIISDNYFKVGDIVKYNGQEGNVLVVGLQTTKIKDLATGNVISIANRNIEIIEIVSPFIYIRLPLSYDIKLEKAENIISNITESIKNNSNVVNCTYKGVAEFADSSIQYLIEVECNQNYKLQVRRDALKSILTELEKQNISIPYNQIDIHSK